MTAKEKQDIKDIIYELSDKFYEIEECIKTPDKKEEFIKFIDEKFKSLQDKCRSYDCDNRINVIITNTINDIDTNDFTNNYQTKYVEILNNLMALYDLFDIRDSNRIDNLVNLQGRINPHGANLLHNSATPSPIPPRVNSPPPPRITGSPLEIPRTPPVNRAISPVFSNSSGLTPQRELQLLPLPSPLPSPLAPPLAPPLTRRSTGRSTQRSTDIHKPKPRKPRPRRHRP